MLHSGIKDILKYDENEYNVIIYGAGAYGKLVYDFLSMYKNVNVAGWVDKNFNNISKEEYPIPILNPKIIKKIKFDYIIIAVTTERFIKEICKFININGIKDEQIILMDENEFDPKKKIQFLEDKEFEVKVYDWNDYIYLRDKYSSYVGLCKQKPGKDSGIIWLLWFQGWDNVPEIVKKCTNSVKKYVRDRKIVYLDGENYTEYIDIPEDIKTMFNEGTISAANYSDIIRLELLKRYGGLWLDATVFLTGTLEDYITDGSIFIFQFPKIQCSRLQAGAVSISTWLMYAQSNNIIIEETLNLLYLYWRKEKKMVNYFAVHFLFRIVTSVYNDEWRKVPYFSNSNCFIMEKELNNPYNKRRMEQILKISKIHKLNYKLNIDTENSMYNYILENM